jgi:hypothetical protein
MKTNRPKNNHRITREPKRLPMAPAAAHQQTEMNEASNAAKSADKAPSLPAEPVTEVAAKINVGFGNQLFIRGQGDGLRWDKGTPLQCRDGSTWVWQTRQAKDKVIFKLLLNDRTWASGEDLVVKAGQKLETVPQF